MGDVDRFPFFHNRIERIYNKLFNNLLVKWLELISMIICFNLQKQRFYFCITIFIDYSAIQFVHISSWLIKRSCLVL